METTERWTPAIGFEGFYEVSDQGRVRSVARIVRMYGTRQYARAGCIRRQNLSTQGYPQVHLSCDGTSRVVAVHCLVAFAFLGERPNGMAINHIDGNKANNTPANLEYCSVANNNRHALRTGLRVNARGSKTGTAKLTEAKVAQIKSQLRNGEQQAAIAKAHGVSRSLISLIALGRIWTHVRSNL